MVVCMGEKDGGLSWLTQHGDKHIQSLTSFTGGLIQCQFSAWGPPGPPPHPSTCLLTGYSPNDWPPDSSVIIYFLDAHTFPSGTIHVIHFYCPLFNLGHSCKILLWNPQLTCCQRSICNTWLKIAENAKYILFNILINCIRQQQCKIGDSPAGIQTIWVYAHIGIFVSASHQTGVDTRSMTQRLIIVGIKGGEGWAWAKAQAQLDYAGHQPTYCNVGLISLAGHGPKSGSRHVCLIIA